MARREADAEKVRGSYDKTHPNLRASRRGRRTYWYVQVGVPAKLRRWVRKRVLTRYVGAVTEAEALRRMPVIVTELRQRMAAMAHAAGVDMELDFTDQFGPTQERERVARTALAAANIAKPNARTIHEAVVGTIEAERDRAPPASVPKNGTVRAVFDRWHEEKVATGRLTRSKGKDDRLRKRIIDMFVEMVGPDRPFADVDHEDAARFKTALIARGLKRKTVDVYMSKVSPCFTAKRPGERNPFSGLGHTKDDYLEEEDARADFTDDQVQALLEAAADEPRLYWLVMVGAYTGARLSEILALERDDVDHEEGVIRFNARDRGKTVSARRAVPIHPELAGLREHVGGRQRVFPFSLSTATRMFSALQDRTGIRSTSVDGVAYRVTFHSLRHGFKTRLLNAGVSNDIADRLTGHARRGLNPRYAKRGSADALREAVKRLSYG